MTKPNLVALGTINPVTIQEYQRYLPTAFSDALTMLEKMNMVIQQLYAVGDLSEEVVTRWNEVMVWVMGDGLEEGIIQRLDELEKDGTLDNIINVKIFNELNQIINGKANIILSKTEPVIKTDSMFWYEVKKEVPVDGK